MPKTLQQLRTLWNKEKEYYQFQEVGSIVQTFVREMLRSPDLFNLKQCPLSKKPETRKMEFIHEKTTKGGRQADYVIYIDQDIIIPVEVESFGKISLGVKQLANYQEDLEKKYGILTDGNTWRFYTDNVYRTFSLKDIFDNPEMFLEYWQEYIKPQTYYLQFFEETGQLSLLGADILFVEDHRPLFFDNITELISKFKNKLRLEGYFNNLTEKEKDKRATEITYAYIIQFILYKTLVDNDFGAFGDEYENIVNSIHQHIRKSNYAKILGIIDGISEKISRNVYRPFSEEQEFIRQKLLKLFHQTQNRLSDVSPWLDIFVFIKKYSFQNVRNEIFGFIYENYLKELFEESQKGQYYTDPAIVNFMIKQVGYDAKELSSKIKKKQFHQLSLCDPACGSGTFMYSAVNEIMQAIPNGSEDASELIQDIVTKNIFGLDIEEFPLYLAEMNIIMRMLPLIITEQYNNPIEKKIKVFKTKDSVSEFIYSDLLNTESDIAVSGGLQQKSLFPIDLGYDSYVRDEVDLAEMKESMRPPRRRFDFVIGNPPYISYNVCSKQGVLVVKLIQEKKVQMSDIYGMNLNTVPGHIKPYAPKPNLYSFFIALGLALLKDNGKLCFIIPQTVLVNTDLDVVRYHLAKFTSIQKIIIFRGKMFIGRGLKQKSPVVTSSLIFVTQRKSPSADHQVEVINYLDPEKDIEECLSDISKNKNVSKIKVKQSELLEKLTNWNFIKADKTELKLMKFYAKNTESLDIYRDYAISRERFGDIFIIDGSINILKKDIVPTVSDSAKNYYKTYKFGKSCSLEPAGYYPKDREIKIAKGSQGLKIIEPRYKIYWKYINHDRFYFIAGEDVIPVYQQYCIASDNEEEIYYLLGVLNSSLTKMILEKNLKVEHEDKLSFLLGVRALKEFVRVPKITSKNEFIKKEIIKNTKMILDLEGIKLSDLVDFSGVLIQKCNDVKVSKSQLVLKAKNKDIKLKIKSQSDLVKKAINDLLGTDMLRLDAGKVGIPGLKELAIVDSEMIDKLKSYIDDLVFALYFDIPVKKVGLSNLKSLKSACMKNKFYKIL